MKKNNAIIRDIRIKMDLPVALANPVFVSINLMAIKGPIFKEGQKGRGVKEKIKKLWDCFKELIILFVAFFKMGLFTFGGGLAMLPLIQHTAVDRYKWVTEDEIVDCFAVSQALPGVIAINAATYIGNKKKGWAGSLAASLGVIMPSFIIIVIAVLFLGAIGDNKYLNGAFTGIKATSCGLIVYAAYKLGRQTLKEKWQWILAIVVFSMIGILGVTALWGIVLGGLVGILVYHVRKNKNKKVDEKTEEGKA